MSKIGVSMIGLMGTTLHISLCPVVSMIGLMGTALHIQLMKLLLMLLQQPVFTPRTCHPRGLRALKCNVRFTRTP